jgi:hypothetical protein
MKLLRITLAAAAVAAAMPMAHAASNSANGAGALNAPVNLIFNVVIPRFLFLRVGDAAAASVNTLTFSPTVAQMLASTPITGTGGDTGPGTSDVTYQVFSNAASTSLGASNLTVLTSGSNNIPTSTLSVVNALGTLLPPAFGASSSLAGPIVSQTGTWRWSWTNPAGTVYASGTYAGTVTYTLSAP